MGEIHKLTKDGITLFPATITDAIAHPELRTTLSNLITVYNVSNLYPSNNITTLSGAIELLGEKLKDEQKVSGIKVQFISSDSGLQEWIYNGNTFDDISNWSRCDSWYTYTDEETPDINDLEVLTADALRKTKQDLTNEERKQVKENIGIAESVISTTWADLKERKDSGTLIPGQYYEINDYKTTTTQENTKAAEHYFNILVEATSTTELNSEAKATISNRDTYFNGIELNKWIIRYDIENNQTKYAWADPVNGRGTIYYLKDEYGNECPYDFKNIMFVRYKLNAPALEGYSYDWQNRMSENINKMFEDNQLSYLWHGIQGENDYCWEDDMGEVISSPTGETKEFYTFSNVINNVVTDKSKTSDCHNNIIKESYQRNDFLLLNNIVFFSTKADICCNSFGNDCNYNSFGNNCNYNSFGNNCNYNSFGNDCNYNSFGNNCNYNSFGNNCYYNSFGNGCNYNSFGNNCYNNSFGNNCYNNSFGNNCYNNSFGNGCNFNNLRDSPDYSYDSDREVYIPDGELLDYFNNNHFSDGCNNIIFWSDPTNADNKIQNLNISQGLGSIEVDDDGNSIPEVIRLTVFSQDYEIKIARNSKGEVKIYCEADLIG